MSTTGAANHVPAPTVIRLRDGDVLVVTLRTVPGCKWLEGLRDRISQTFPDHEVFFLDPGIGLFAVGADDMNEHDTSRSTWCVKFNGYLAAATLGMLLAHMAMEHWL